MTGLLMSLLGCLGSQHVTSIGQFTQSNNPKDLPTLLESPYAYVRLHTVEQVQQQNWSPNSKDDPIVLLMMEILRDPKELCATRGQSAYTLGQWQIYDSARDIVDALNTCDDESRYWMVLGLENLAEGNPIASGALSELQYDADIFIRTEVQQWMVNP